VITIARLPADLIINYSVYYTLIRDVFYVNATWNVKQNTPDVRLRSEYQVQYGLWSHPADWHQSATVQSVIVGHVDVTRQAKVCTNKTIMHS